MKSNSSYGNLLNKTYIIMNILLYEKYYSTAL